MGKGHGGVQDFDVATAGYFAVAYWVVGLFDSPEKPTCPLCILPRPPDTLAEAVSAAARQ